MELDWSNRVFDASPPPDPQRRTNPQIQNQAHFNQATKKAPIILCLAAWWLRPWIAYNV
jgi:hypothetical protein